MQPSISDELRGVSSGDESLCQMLDIKGEIKDAKMSSFSSDFQTLIKHKISFVFSLWIINELKKDVFVAVAVVVSYC